MAELGFPIRRRHTGRSRHTHPCRRPAAGHRPPDHLASALVLAAAGYRVQPDDRRKGTATAAPPVGEPCRRKHPAVSTVGPEALTGRQRHVLEPLACGLSDTEIAGRLALSEHTVKTHVRHLLGEPRLHNRIHAAIHAFETGLRTLA